MPAPERAEFQVIASGRRKRVRAGIVYMHWGQGDRSILFQFARHDRFISDAFARDYVKAAGGSHEVRWYFTSHEFNDPDSPRDRLEFLARKLALAP